MEDKIKVIIIGEPNAKMLLAIEQAKENIDVIIVNSEEELIADRGIKLNESILSVNTSHLIPEYSEPKKRRKSKRRRPKKYW